MVRKIEDLTQDELQCVYWDDEIDGFPYEPIAFSSTEDYEYHTISLSGQLYTLQVYKMGDERRLIRWYPVREESYTSYRYVEIKDE